MMRPTAGLLSLLLLFTLVHAEKDRAWTSTIFLATSGSDVIRVDACYSFGPVLEKAEHRGLAAAAAWLALYPTSPSDSAVLELVALRREAVVTPNWTVFRLYAKPRDVAQVLLALKTSIAAIPGDNAALSRLPAAFPDSIRFPLAQTVAPVLDNALIRYPPPPDAIAKLPVRELGALVSRYLVPSNCTVIWRASHYDNVMHNTIAQSLKPEGGAAAENATEFGPDLLLGKDRPPLRALRKGSGWLLPLDDLDPALSLVVSHYLAADNPAGLSVFELGAHRYASIAPATNSPEPGTVLELKHSGEIADDLRMSRALADAARVLREANSGVTDALSPSVVLASPVLDRARITSFHESTSDLYRKFMVPALPVNLFAGKNSSVWARRAGGDQAGVTVIAGATDTAGLDPRFGLSMLFPRLAPDSEQSLKLASELHSRYGIQAMPCALCAPIEEYPQPVVLKVQCPLWAVGVAVRLIWASLDDQPSKPEAELENTGSSIACQLVRAYSGRQPQATSLWAGAQAFVSVPGGSAFAFVPPVERLTLHKPVVLPPVATCTEPAEASGGSGVVLWAHCNSLRGREVETTAALLYARKIASASLDAGYSPQLVACDLGGSSATALRLSSDKPMDALVLRGGEVWRRLAGALPDDRELVALNNELEAVFADFLARDAAWEWLGSRMYGDKRGPFVESSIPSVDRFALGAALRSMFPQEFAVVRLSPQE